MAFDRPTISEIKDRIAKSKERQARLLKNIKDEAILRKRREYFNEFLKGENFEK